MKWLQLLVKVPKTDAENITGFLENAGAVSVTYTDSGADDIFEPPIGETPLWSEVNITGLFPAKTDIKQIWQQLILMIPLAYLPDLKIEKLADKDWVRVWMDDFKPMRFGQNLWIIPDGYDIPRPKAINIKLDPGLAFGTGTHPTTALCLKWLDANPPTGKTVIDYGCGSGILSLAAAKLGAKQVIAVDIDPQALTATISNAHKNNIDNISTMPTNDIKADSADVLLANILAAPLLNLVNDFARILKSGGSLVLSGILHKQLDEIKQCYSKWFNLQVETIQDGWVCVEGIRNEN